MKLHVSEVDNAEEINLAAGRLPEPERSGLLSGVLTLYEVALVAADRAGLVRYECPYQSAGPGLAGLYEVPEVPGGTEQFEELAAYSRTVPEEFVEITYDLAERARQDADTHPEPQVLYVAAQDPAGGLAVAMAHLRGKAHAARAVRESAGQAAVLCEALNAKGGVPGEPARNTHVDFQVYTVSLTVAKA